MAVRLDNAAVTPDQIERAEWAAIRSAVQPQLPMAVGEAEWRGKAACGTEDPDLFLPAGPDDPQVQKAISICLTRCPAIKQCKLLRYRARGAGVWGGVYYPEVGTALKGCKIEGCDNGVQSPRNPYCGPEHEHAGKIGTRSGYAMHRRLKEDVCAECKAGEHEGKRKYDQPSGGIGSSAAPILAVGRTAGGGRRAIIRANVNY